MFTTGFSIGWTLPFGTTGKCNELVGTGDTTIPSADFGFMCFFLRVCMDGIFTKRDFCKQFLPVRDLGGQCSHQPGAHESIQGKIDAWAISKVAKQHATRTIGRSVCYHYSTPVAVFLTIFVGHPVNNWFQRKTTADFPIFSGGWGRSFFPPQTGAKQIEANQMFFNRCVTHGFNILFTIDWTRLYFNILFPTIPILHFLMKFCSHSDMTLNNFLRAHDETPDWTVREHQPMHLNILEPISKIMGEPRHPTFSFTSSWG